MGTSVYELDSLETAIFWVTDCSRLRMRVQVVRQQFEDMFPGQIGSIYVAHDTSQLAAPLGFLQTACRQLQVCPQATGSSPCCKPWKLSQHIEAG